jgi:hypothetical protein
MGTPVGSAEINASLPPEIDRRELRVTCNCLAQVHLEHRQTPNERKRPKREPNQRIESARLALLRLQEALQAVPQTALLRVNDSFPVRREKDGKDGLDRFKVLRGS